MSTRRTRINRDLTERVEHLFRHSSGRITASLVRLMGFEHIDLIEDALQDALVKALRKWPFSGIPENPSAWLTQAAKNGVIDVLRRRARWNNKQQQIIEHVEALADRPETSCAINDDQLQMIFACCHPAISTETQIALTLKAVCGFSAYEIACAFLVKPSAIAQRLVRAKRQLLEHDIQLEMPGRHEVSKRLDAVLKVIYLIFNEGYYSNQQNQLIRKDLCFEAIRLGECLLENSELDRPEVHALIALMYLQAARLPARMDSDNNQILLADQNRTCWDQRMIAKGTLELKRSASGQALSKYHLEAEISACHTLAPSYRETNWRQVLSCYEILLSMEDNAVIAVNHAVALLHAHGARVAQEALAALKKSKNIEQYGPYHITCAAVARQLGQREAQQQHLHRARQLSRNTLVQQFLSDHLL